MATLGDIRAHIAAELATIVSCTDQPFDLTSGRIWLGHHFRTNDEDYKTDLVDYGPQVVIEPGEVISWLVQTRKGTARVRIRVNFGFNQTEDRDLMDEEALIQDILFTLSQSTGLTPMSMQVVRPNLDQIRTGLLEYVIVTDGWWICGTGCG